MARIYCAKRGNLQIRSWKTEAHKFDAWETTKFSSAKLDEKRKLSSRHGAVNCYIEKDSKQNLLAFWE